MKKSDSFNAYFSKARTIDSHAARSDIGAIVCNSLVICVIMLIELEEDEVQDDGGDGEVYGDEMWAVDVEEDGDGNIGERKDVKEGNGLRLDCGWNFS